jgi:molybdate transport system substrate-binding protein
MSPRWRLLAGLVLLGAPLAPCSSNAKTTGSVTTFAAASLTEAFADLTSALKASDPGLTLTFSFAGSGLLVTQIIQGAPADVIATADTASMKRLTDAGLVDPPATFARNKLEILVRSGNPKGIHALSDLARSDITLVVEDDAVPAGKYAAQALRSAGVTTHPVSKEPDVKSAVAKVTSGEADATVVYVTDVAAAGAKAQGVPIPDVQNVVAEYVIAIVKATKQHAAAAALVQAVMHGPGPRVLRKRGFLGGA